MEVFLSKHGTKRLLCLLQVQKYARFFLKKNRKEKETKEEDKKEKEMLPNGKRNRLQLNSNGDVVFINVSSVVRVYKLIESLIL